MNLCRTIVLIILIATTYLHTYIKQRDNIITPYAQLINWIEKILVSQIMGAYIHLIIDTQH